MKPLVSVFVAAVSSLPALVSAATPTIPTSVPFAAAPKAWASAAFPSCSNTDRAGLPPRLDFTRTVPPAPYSAEAQRSSSLYADHWFKRPRDLPAKDLHVERKMGEEGGPSWWRFGYWGHGVSVPAPIALASTYGPELGFGKDETAILVGDRVYKSYPNGAVSLGYLRRVEQRDGVACPPNLTCCGPVKPARGAGFLSTLPGPGERLGDPPDLSGRDALATVHDMNPYLAFLPIDDTGAPRASRLVVVSTPALASRLAWEVRYAFSCIETKNVPHGFAVQRRVAYAYVDARSGALVVGQDRWRLAGAEEGDL